MKKELKIQDITKDSIKCSRFGCMNCLWASIECKAQEKFKPRVYNNVASCESYTYYD